MRVLFIRIAYHSVSSSTSTSAVMSGFGRVAGCTSTRLHFRRCPPSYRTSLLLGQHSGTCLTLAQKSAVPGSEMACKSGSTSSAKYRLKTSFVAVRIMLLVGPSPMFAISLSQARPDKVSQADISRKLLRSPSFSSAHQKRQYRH